MAVTDLTDSLPYWARQGVGYGGGPGPTGGPGSAPMGAGNSASWLQYLQQMFGPQAAQAAMTQQNGDNPHGDGPPGPVSANPLLGSSVGMNPPPGPMTGPAGPASNLPPPPTSAASIGPPAPAARGPGGIGSDVRFPLTQQGPDYQTQQPDPRLLPANSNPNAPPLAASAAPGAANPLAVAGPGAAGPVPGPLASGGATGAGASANPRFVGIPAPNMSPQNSMRGGPQGTALNLAGLFGGGGAPGAPRGVNPANLPARGPMARGAPSGDDWDIDANGNVVPNYGPLGNAPGNQQMSPDALASAVKKPNWWQSLGRPDMSPDQLASAVRKPNWYRNV